jgi:hypothetical protein
MRIQEVVAGASSQESDKALGFADPELVVTVTGKKPEGEGKEAPKSVLVVGSKSADGKGWNVRRQGETWVFKVSEDSLERMRKDPDSFLVKPPAPPEGAKEGEPKDVAPPSGEEKPGEEKPADGKPAEEKPGDPKPGGPPAEGSPDGD